MVSSLKKAMTLKGEKTKEKGCHSLGASKPPQPPKPSGKKKVREESYQLEPCMTRQKTH